MVKTEGEPKSLGIIPTLGKLLTPGGKMELIRDRQRNERLRYNAALDNFLAALEPHENQIDSLVRAQKGILQTKETPFSPASRVSSKVIAEQTDEGLLITLEEVVSASVPVPSPNSLGSTVPLGGCIWDHFDYVPMLEHEIDRVLMCRGGFKPMLVMRGKRTTYNWSSPDASSQTEEMVSAVEEVTDHNIIIDILNKISKVLSS